MSEVSTMSDIVTLHAGRVLLHMKHALFVLYVALFLLFFGPPAGMGKNIQKLD